MDRNNPKDGVRALNDAIAQLKAGRSFIVFPEGTRWKGKEGEIGEFKNGVLRIAVKSGAPIVPVAITRSRDCMENHHMLVNPTEVTVRILPPVETKELDRNEQKELTDRLAQMIKENIAV